MAKYILSTLTNSFMFIKYGPRPGMTGRKEDGKNFNLKPVEARVRIGGGANLPSTLNAFGDMGKDQEGIPFWTPRGMVTTIQDSTWEWLKEDRNFQIFMKMGHITVMEQDPGMDHRKLTRIVENDMEGRDGYAPLRPGDKRLDPRVMGKTGTDHVEEDFRI